MRYPLDNYENLQYGYKFGDKTHYSDFHFGIDKFAPKWERVYAPDNGAIIQKIWGAQGGNTIHYEDANGKLWRFLHLVEFGGLWGHVKQGDIIGYVGNTGSLGGGSHLHYDISKGDKLILNKNNFINPETYIKDNIMKYPPDKVVWNKKDGEFYWTKKEGYLNIKDDRLLFASLLKKGDAITVDEEIKPIIGDF